MEDIGDPSIPGNLINGQIADHSRPTLNDASPTGQGAGGNSPVYSTIVLDSVQMFLIFAQAMLIYLWKKTYRAADIEASAQWRVPRSSNRSIGEIGIWRNFSKMAALCETH